VTPVPSGTGVTALRAHAQILNDTVTPALSNGAGVTFCGTVTTVSQYTISIKNRVLAAAATLTLVGAVGLAGAGTASAARPSCGHQCIDIFGRQFGTHTSPGYVVDVLRQGEKTDQPVIVFRTADDDPAEDWTLALQGTTADFYSAGLVSSAVALHYGCVPGAGGNFTDCYGQAKVAVDDPAFEIEYAPFGVDTGMCMGVAATAFRGEGVTLQPCGVSPRTVWIADVFDSPSTLFTGYVPAINGSDTNFSQPFVLTYPASGSPAGKPRPQLVVTNLTGFSQTSPPLHIPGPELGTVDGDQLWGADFGILKQG
jgi:hypothetical protein